MGDHYKQWNENQQLISIKVYRDELELDLLCLRLATGDLDLRRGGLRLGGDLIKQERR